MALHEQQEFAFPSEGIIPDRPNSIGHAEVNYVSVKEILTRATGFMDAYDYTLNPYSGCSFGCTYCYAAFFSRSAEKRDSWGRWVDVKDNALSRFRQLRRKLDGKFIYMSSVTDPYQPVERKIRLTRGLLEIMAEGHRPKLVIQTRSPDVIRDIDLFHRIEGNGGRVQVNVTVTTDDEDVRRIFEPYCPGNLQRLDAARTVVSSGIEVCITMTPLLSVRDPASFTEKLLETGVEKFIVQPFHFQKGKFLAGTREPAMKLMAEKLHSTDKDFPKIYLQHYRQVHEILRERLPSLGEGKEGFQPPF